MATLQLALQLPQDIDLRSFFVAVAHPEYCAPDHPRRGLSSRLDWLG